MINKEDLNVRVTSSFKRGFGDHLLTFFFTSILRNNGINAIFDPPSYYDICNYVKSPYIIFGRRPLKYRLSREKVIGKMSQTFYSDWTVFKVLYKYGEKGVKPTPIIEQFCCDFEKYFGIKIRNNFNYIPVKYRDIPEIPSVDVSLSTVSGPWAKYRNWPYFSDLKRRMDKYGISYIDLSKNKILFMDCLNYVKKSKVYVGVETGISHYVSQVANGKALILQSGLVNSDFWSSYDYEFLSIDVQCKFCKLNNKEKCMFDHKCMKELSVDMVFDKIMERLNK